MDFSLQTPLFHEEIALIPLEESDFELLFQAAADPEIWEQHPNKDRWKKEVFRTFFDGAIKSCGAYKIVDQKSGSVIGSTRFYDFDTKTKTIFIGYTFFTKASWGKGLNRIVKQMMLDHIFQFADKVLLHIGAENKRSQISIERIGAIKVAEEEVAYYGEATKLNFVYEIGREIWSALRQ